MSAERCGGKPGHPKFREEENDYRGPWHERNEVCAIAPTCTRCLGCEDCRTVSCTRLPECASCGCSLLSESHKAGCANARKSPRFTTAELVEAVREAKQQLNGSYIGIIGLTTKLDSVVRRLEWIAEAEKGLQEMASSHPRCEICGEIATNLLAKLREI